VGLETVTKTQLVVWDIKVKLRGYGEYRPSIIEDCLFSYTYVLQFNIVCLIFNLYDGWGPRQAGGGGFLVGSRSIRQHNLDIRLSGNRSLALRS